MSEKEKHPLDAKDIDWDNDPSLSNQNRDNSGSGGNSDSTIEWVKFQKPGTYTFRFVGKGVKFLRHGKPFNFRDRVITDPEYAPPKKGQEKDPDMVDPAWAAGFYPRSSFAMFCIDRADGKVKIFDKGKSIFGPLKTYQDGTKTRVGGKEAPDFQITVDWPGGDKFQAKYTVMPITEKKPLTQEEYDAVKAVMENADLGVIYRSKPLAEIKELWEGVPADKRVPKKDDRGAPQSASSSIPVVDTSDDADLFSGDDDETSF